MKVQVLGTEISDGTPCFLQVRGPKFKLPLQLSTLLFCPEKLYFHMTLTHHDVMGKHLSDGSKKNYGSAIGKMKEKMTDDERSIYLNAGGWLIRPLHHEVAARVLHACQLRNLEEGSDQMKSQSTATLYSSAMKYWHKESSRLRDYGRDDPIIISHDLVAYLSEYSTGRRRMTADVRATGEETESEGKLPIDLLEFKSLARAAMASGTNPKDARLYHGYLILCWNLIARSSTVADLLWNNIGWQLQLM